MRRDALGCVGMRWDALRCVEMRRDELRSGSSVHVSCLAFWWFRSRPQLRLTSSCNSTKAEITKQAKTLGQARARARKQER